jgi:hypothetical protein
VKKYRERSQSDGGTIELEIVRQFERRTPFGGVGFGGGGKRIVGHIENNKIVTLDDCFYKRIGGGIGISKSLIHVGRVFIGVKYDEGEIPLFNSLTCSVEGIDEWVGISGIEFDLQHEERATTISYQRPAEVELNLGNGMQLLITFSLGTRLSRIKEARISQKTYFTLISQEARELDNFTSVVRKITNFLCFAMDQTVSLDSMSATSDNLRQDIGEGKTGTIPIDIYYPSWPYSKDEPDTNESKLFEFKEIQNDAGRIISNWIEAYEQIAPTFNLYFLAKMGMQTYLEARFLALAQGLEAYHRRTSDEKRIDEAEFDELVENLVNQCPEEHREWLSRELKYGNEVNLRKRLRGIINSFKEVIGNRAKRENLINRIVNTRNYLTHYDLSLESKAAKDEELWPLCLKMELLFQLHFLQLIGFSHEQIDSLLAKSIPLSWKRWLLS